MEFLPKEIHGEISEKSRIFDIGSLAAVNKTFNKYYQDKIIKKKKEIFRDIFNYMYNGMYIIPEYYLVHLDNLSQKEKDSIFYISKFVKGFVNPILLNVERNNQIHTTYIIFKTTMKYYTIHDNVERYTGKEINAPIISIEIKRELPGNPPETLSIGTNQGKDLIRFLNKRIKYYAPHIDKNGKRWILEFYLDLDLVLFRILSRDDIDDKFLSDKDKKSFRKLYKIFNRYLKFCWDSRFHDDDYPLEPKKIGLKGFNYDYTPLEILGTILNAKFINIDE